MQDIESAKRRMGAKLSRRQALAGGAAVAGTAASFLSFGGVTAKAFSLGGPNTLQPAVTVQGTGNPQVAAYDVMLLSALIDTYYSEYWYGHNDDGPNRNIYNTFNNTNPADSPMGNYPGTSNGADSVQDTLDYINDVSGDEADFWADTISTFYGEVMSSGFIGSLPTNIWVPVAATLSWPGFIETAIALEQLAVGIYLYLIRDNAVQGANLFSSYVNNPNQVAAELSLEGFAELNLAYLEYLEQHTYNLTLLLMVDALPGGASYNQSFGNDNLPSDPEGDGTSPVWVPITFGQQIGPWTNPVVAPAPLNLAAALGGYFQTGPNKANMPILWQSIFD